MRKYISIILSLLILVSSTINVFASSDVLQGEGKNVNLLKKIEYSYYSMADSTAICYYTDDYFANSSYEYNQSLATMSLSLAFSAFGSSWEVSNGYSNKSIYAEKLLQQIGIAEEDISVNEWYNVKPTEDSIGVIAGNMPISVKEKDYTLVAVAIRGAGYEREWASNFTIGLTEEHRGFEEGKEQVLSFLKDYFSEQNISGPVKLWITGYSRSAAVANLVGGELDRGYVLDDDITYELGDIYAYTFETPSGALISDVQNQTIYNNIFNIINPNDPVPLVAPYRMGFTRYGLDVIIPTAESNPTNYEAYKAKMLEFYYSFEGTTEYIVDDFQMKKLGIKNWLPGGDPIEYIVDDTKNNYSQSVYLSKYIDIISDEFFLSRENYVTNYEAEIREIFSVLFGCTAEQQKILMDSLTAQVQANWGALAWSYVWNAGLNPWGDKVDALKMVSDWLKTAINDAGITDYDEAVIESAGIALADLMLALVTSHPNYFSTAMMNIEGLGQAHYPEVCLAWMQTFDSNYNSANVEYTLNKNAYRIVYIDGDADVNAYKEDGTLVASIVDDVPVKIKNSNYYYGVDDGSKYVIFPIDQLFTVKIESDSDSTINYTVKEYNSSVGYTRLVEYKGASFIGGEYLAGDIPTYSAEEIKSGAPYGSTVQYTLINSNGNVESSVSDISRNSMFTLNAKSSNEQFGFVTGSGTYKYGEKAVLVAENNIGCKFVGWYENGVLVCENLEYEVNAYSDGEYIAVFESKELTPIEGNGVFIKDGIIYGLWDNLDEETVKTLFIEAEPLFTDAEKFIGTGTEFTYYDRTYTSVILGDVDGDGEVGATDYLRIKSAFIEGFSIDGLCLIAADVDGDGGITSTDYLRIKSHFLGQTSLYNNKVA